MKYIKLLIIFFVVDQLVYAQEIQNIYHSIEYKNALKDFTNKKYQSAFNKFDILVQQHSDNEKINFYYGRSAFELKKYEFAFAAFDRILIKNPMNHRARLEYARTLFMMKSHDEAKKEFEKVLSSSIPQQVRKNVVKFLKIIEKTKKGYRLNHIAIFGFGWDNNINNTTYENQVLVNSIPFDNDTNKQTDKYLNFILVNKLFMPLPKKQYSWESTATLYTQQQSKYTANTIDLFSLLSGVGYTQQKYRNLTSLSYDYIRKGSESFMAIYGARTENSFNILEENLIKTELFYKNKNMINLADKDKESTLKGINIAYTFPTLGTTKDTVTLKYSLQKEDKKRGTRVDISKNIAQYKVNYHKFFTNDIDINLSYQYDITKYKDNFTILGVPIKRIDKKNNISLKVSKMLNRSNIISLTGSKINTHSTINTYAYKKTTAVFNYIKIF